MAQAAGAIDVPPVAVAITWHPPDRRRLLQLSLAAIWLLDGVLQFQPFMFTRDFSQQMLAGTAVGNPWVIAHPILWMNHAFAQHAAAVDTGFALVQILIGLGIAWRPTTKVALGGSIAWALGVWWIGEGLGGILTGATSAIMGAPGAVLIYALLAVLLWPGRRDRDDAGFVAARTVGATVARALWCVLWGAMAAFTIATAVRVPGYWREMISGMTGGEPHWILSMDSAASSLSDHTASLISVAVGVVLVAVAVGIYLRPSAVRVVLVVAVVVSLGIWVVGENFGTLLGGSGTDPNSGPLLVVLAVAYWPTRAVAGAPSVGAPAVVTP